ncbi:unnamed protein product [Absidia cylindrospora]
MSTIGNENDYIDNYLKELSTRSVRYGQDYLARSLPSPLRIKRKPIHKQPEATTEDSGKAAIKDENPTTDSFELLVKILKPASQFRITRLQLDDTILNLKQRIYQQQTIPVKQQRLLLKGKVLNDEKSLGDYQMTKDTTLHLWSANLLVRLQHRHHLKRRRCQEQQQHQAMDYHQKRNRWSSLTPFGIHWNKLWMGN